MADSLGVLMIFDSPQWPIVRDPSGPREYCGAVKNTVVVRSTHTARRVYIRVPTAVFPFLTQLLSSPLSAFADAPVSFYLEEDEKLWVFGLYARGDYYDLWPYTSLPKWAEHYET